MLPHLSGHVSRFSGRIAVLWGKELVFSSDRNAVPLATGGNVEPTMLGPAATPGGSYDLVLDSMSGTAPWLKIGWVSLPLNPNASSG